jgi:S-adenosylmethionine/arginine decarboxylase-like enzyme
VNNSKISEDEYERRGVWGMLTSIDLFGCDHEILSSGEKIKQYAIEVCDLIDMKRFGEPVVVRFGADPKVSGYSLAQLIETSLISGHFAETDNSVYIDIFSCKFYDQEKAVEFTKKFFKAQNLVFNTTLRGATKD